MNLHRKCALQLQEESTTTKSLRNSSRETLPEYLVNEIFSHMYFFFYNFDEDRFSMVRINI
jgi:hypothetical protein